MNNQATAAVTKALDSAIDKVAREEFRRLSARLNRQGIADKIHGALRSLERLQSGLMPDYDAWDALFYSLWYQPGQINLAYTLAEHVILVEKTFFRDGSLQVHDFGCGALAMQFGLALAVTDAIQKGKTFPEVVIISEDASEPMTRIGWKIWHSFVSEIAKYPELSSVLGVCRSMRFDHQDDLEGSCWLTVLHVAYEENSDQVKLELDNRVAKLKPDLVLVTTHSISENWAYSPLDHGYTSYSSRILGIIKRLGDNDSFRATTKFRSDLYDNHIARFSALLTFKDRSFVQGYLKKWPTKWNAIGSQQTVQRLYLKT